MRFCYADPPYAGQAKKHYGSDSEVDFPTLITNISNGDYDAWALSVHANQLRDVLPLCPTRTRIAIWNKPYATFKKGVNPTYAWEPVLFKGPPRGMNKKFIHDFLVCSPVMKAQIVGQKPIDFMFWIFELLGAGPGDEFHDWFPGSKVGKLAWDLFTENYRDGEYKHKNPKRTHASVRDTVGKI